MRRQMFSLSILAIMFIAFTSLAYLHYSKDNRVLAKECCNKKNGNDSNGDMFFESVVKNLVEAIIISK